MTSDLIVIAVVALMTGAAALYIRSEKKKGRHCIGCPNSKSCSGCCSMNSEK